MKKPSRLRRVFLIDDPACIEAAEEIADNLLSLEKFEEAEKAASYSLRLDPKSYIGHFVVGFVASEQEEWKTAEQHFRVSNFEQPNNPEIIRCLGWTIFHAGRQEEGISTILRALSLRKDDPAILCDLAACYLQMNKFDESIELLEKAMDVDSADDRVSELFHVANRLKKAFASEIS
jgi:Tfp pilus assembly protein PilF